ncbi:MAG: hypothetical protein VKK04_03400 [Synechococcales bacterium]|nr:hypothetical protein [Synechococcales bacterium]
MPTRSPILHRWLRYGILSLLTTLMVTVACTQPNAIPIMPSLRASLMPLLAPLGLSSPRTWAFEPAVDTYDGRSQLDLRFLNEAVAGESGFVHLSEDGRDFVKGDGTPLRFWAVNSSVWERSPADLPDHARFLAKRGVNMVRWHGHLFPETEGAALTDINETERDRLWQMVAAMKQAGIYLTLSPYYAKWAKAQPQWPIPRDSDNFHGLLFFDPTLQEAYKSWLRSLLLPENPYTGIALKDDPAIAIIQLQNEDSLLFWTLQSIQGAERQMLCRQFGAWLAEKYGSMVAVRAAWEDTELDGDDWDQAVPQLYPVWDLTQPPPQNSGKAQRLADQTEFLTTRMRQFNADMVRFLREEIGAQQLINAGNWKTASVERLNDAERYSYTPTEVIGVNRYYNGGRHEGDSSGWAILNGDRFTNQSILTHPTELPTNLKQVAHHPMIISESSWVPPLGYQSEGPFLVSVFQSLTGVDGFYWFNTGEAQWRSPSSANGFRPSLGKWVINTPELMGNFPAAALMYRQGYIRQGTPVVQEHRRLEGLWRRRSPRLWESQSFDPNRDEASRQTATTDSAVDPLAFLVGPVEVTYGSDESTAIANLSPYIHSQDQTVESITGEISWNYGDGVCTVNAPQAQGATGFLNRGGAIALTDLEIASHNDYATVLAVSMDGQPLAASQQILIQTGTIARSTGWTQQPITWEDDRGRTYEGYEVLNYGEAPWQVTANRVKLKLRNNVVQTATALDMNGMPLQTIPLRRRGDRVTLTLPPDGKYFMLS